MNCKHIIINTEYPAAGCCCINNKCRLKIKANKNETKCTYPYCKELSNGKGVSVINELKSKYE